MSTLKTGKVKTTTIADELDTESTAVTNVINGSAKAWINFNGEGTVAIRRSFNVTSIVDNGTGIYTVNFTTSMPDANYSTLVTLEQAEFAAMGSPSTSSVMVYCVRRTDTLSRTDNAFMNVAVFS